MSANPLPDRASGAVYYCADCGQKLDGLGIGHGTDCLVPLIDRLRAENEQWKRDYDDALRIQRAENERLRASILAAKTRLESIPISPRLLIAIGGLDAALDPAPASDEETR